MVVKTLAFPLPNQAGRLYDCVHQLEDCGGLRQWALPISCKCKVTYSGGFGRIVAEC